MYRRAVARPLPKPDPAPLETDDVRVVGIGTAVWAVLFLVLLPFRARLVATGHGWWLWTCLVGTLLGLVGVGYCRRRRAAIGRDRAASEVAPPAREPLP